MKLGIFLEEKIGLILFNISLITFLSIYLTMLKISAVFISFLVVIWIIILFLYLLFSYLVLNHSYKVIINLVDSLEEKYLIAEVLKRPKSLHNYAYFYALKKACKSMNDKISSLEDASRNYKDYIESFVHEIKTPISSLALYFENHQDSIKEEVKRIDNLVEQMLYYARSEVTEKDYFIKKVFLEDLVHKVLMDYKELLLRRKIRMNIHDLGVYIYCDEKWLLFILGQIVQNSIKYLDKTEKTIEIFSVTESSFIKLVVRDNGCGISIHDLPRIFEKGFTGSDRQKDSSTGMGLYLCKTLCDKLNLGLEIQSIEKVNTEVNITFPLGNVHNL